MREGIYVVQSTLYLKILSVEGTRPHGVQVQHLEHVW